MPKKVLIVEDEKPMARALELKLNNSGFEAKTAQNGAMALEILAKEQFDLMLMDLIMPVMDGFKLLEELKNKGSKMPVIVSTNLSQEEDKKRVMDLGAVDYFVKADVPINQVLEKVKQKLEV